MFQKELWVLFEGSGIQQKDWHPSLRSTTFLRYLETWFILVWVCLIRSTYSSGIGNVCIFWVVKRQLRFFMVSMNKLFTRGPRIFWFASLFNRLLRCQHHLLAQSFPPLLMMVLDDEGVLEFPFAHGNTYSSFSNTSWFLNFLNVDVWEFWLLQILLICVTQSLRIFLSVFLFQWILDLSFAVIGIYSTNASRGMDYPLT